ncbi:hypothetical protein HPB51_027676 [Rhipicephalus microplus]|uniref:Uncharacterized protein n=1 Tax=Rhipicephalus microplus TaxID=6941 RepID=A0A9J6CZG3_RHIMP|nr:hypothetical protein HPB51_027676 [Rhipicephalus microplus]
MSCFTIEAMDRFLVHARLVLWQRVAVQMLRRHWFASIIELLATVACFTQVGHIAPRPEELGNFTTARLFPARYAFPGEWPTFVVYQPPSAYAEDLLASYRQRAEIFEYLNVRSPVKAVRSELELRDACRVHVREAFERDYVLCVSFHGGALPDGVNGSTGFPSLNYTLHMFIRGSSRKLPYLWTTAATGRRCCSSWRSHIACRSVSVSAAPSPRLRRVSGHMGHMPVYHGPQFVGMVDVAEEFCAKLSGQLADPNISTLNVVARHHAITTRTNFFSIHELKAALALCRRTSAPGPDEMSYRALCHLGECARNALLEIYNDSWR